MALRLAGEDIGVQEVVTTLTYAPSLQNSGDLEPATRTITATAKPGVADYTASLTIPAPPSQLKVLRLGLRLQVTIDSFGGTPAATQLSYAVHVNGAERLTGVWTATGAQFAAVDLTEGQFNLETANTIGIYLWVNQGNAVVSLAQVWLAVGSRNVVPNVSSIMQILHHGFLSLSAFLRRVGTGTPELLISTPHVNWLQFASVTGDQAKLTVPSLVSRDSVLVCQGTVATDLNYVEVLVVNLRTVS